MPLDFRTASINEGNDIIIQVKPLHHKPMDAIPEEESKDIDKLVKDEDYLDALRMQAFADDDEQVQLLDPGFDFEKIFGSVKLPCEEIKRINNQIDAKEL